MNCKSAASCFFVWFVVFVGVLVKFSLAQSGSNVPCFTDFWCNLLETVCPSSPPNEREIDNSDFLFAIPSQRIASGTETWRCLIATDVTSHILAAAFLAICTSGDTIWLSWNSVCSRCKHENEDTWNARLWNDANKLCDMSDGIC